MRAFFLLAFIGLLGLVLAEDDPDEDAVAKYNENFIENFQRNLDEIRGSDKADLERLGDLIYGQDNAQRWVYGAVTIGDIASGVVQFIEQKTGNVVDDLTVLDIKEDLDGHLHDLCERISGPLSIAMHIFKQNRQAFYSRFNDETVLKWISIGVFCEDLSQRRERLFMDIKDFIEVRDAADYETDDGDDSAK